MNLDQIADRIAAPASCMGSEIPAFRDLTEKYPFAQVFSILYLKALSNHQDVGFDEALQKHAYKITDRMKLYDLIHPTESIQRDVTTREPISETEIVESTGNRDKELTLGNDNFLNSAIAESNSKEALPKITENLALNEEIVDLTSLVGEGRREIEEESIAESHEINIEKELVDEKHSNLNISDLNLEIISEVVTAVYHENLENSIPILEKEEKISEQPENELSTSEPTLLDTKKSFTSWLKMGQQTTLKLTPDLIEDDSEEIKIIEKQIDNIIDNFIKTEPSISRPKKEFYSPTKKAKESINPDGLIYSETLANILAIQGNFSKAIVAYEQLMLTNPEKKIFFAKRIEELKEKLKS